MRPEEARQNAPDGPFPAAFGPDEEQHLLEAGVAAEDVANSFLERANRGRVIGPELLQKLLPARRWRRLRVERKRQRMLVEEGRRIPRISNG
jgi:hypothetical protein